MIRRLEVNMLVGICEVADTAQVTTQAVTNWIARYSDFPKPLKILRCGPVFYLPEIESWLRKTGRF